MTGNAPPHVLYLTFHLPRPGEPGAARPWEELQLMRELGWRVTVVTASAHYLTGHIDRPVRWLWRADREDGGKILRTWFPANYRRSMSRRLFGYLSYCAIGPLAGWSIRDVDVVFAGTDPPFATVGAYLLARRHGARLVLDERDVHPDQAMASGMSLPRVVAALLLGWNRWVLKRAFAVVTVSPGLKCLLISRGAPAERTYVLPNYFPREVTAKLDETSDHGTHDDDFVVLYAGSLGQATSVETCLQAASLLQRWGYDRIRFLFLGAGERIEEYRAACVSRGIKHVEFPGAVPRYEMDEVYASAQIAIHAFPRHPYWRHALSSKIFDYLAHGKPVVFAGEGDIAALLAESGGGVVVLPEDAAGMADAIARLFDQPDLRARMGASGIRYLREHFDRHRCATTLARACGVIR